MTRGRHLLLSFLFFSQKNEKMYEKKKTRNRSRRVIFSGLRENMAKNT